jgi:hypothetical protein
MKTNMSRVALPNKVGANTFKLSMDPSYVVAPVFLNGQLYFNFVELAGGEKTEYVLHVLDITSPVPANAEYVGTATHGAFLRHIWIEYEASVVTDTP